METLQPPSVNPTSTTTTQNNISAMPISNSNNSKSLLLLLGGCVGVISLVGLTIYYTPLPAFIALSITSMLDNKLNEWIESIFGDGINNESKRIILWSLRGFIFTTVAISSKVGINILNETDKQDKLKELLVERELINEYKDGTNVEKAQIDELLSINNLMIKKVNFYINWKKIGFCYKIQIKIYQKKMLMRVKDLLEKWQSSKVKKTDLYNKILKLKNEKNSNLDLEKIQLELEECMFQLLYQNNSNIFKLLYVNANNNNLMEIYKNFNLNLKEIKIGHNKIPF